MPGDTTLGAADLPPLPVRRRAARVVHSPDGDALGRTFSLDGKTWLLGRTAPAPAGISDARVSREHARFRPGEASYVIEDLGTRNGTFLNGRRLSRPSSLLANDVVAIGDTLLVVDQDVDPDLLPAREEETGTSVVECLGISYAAQSIRRAIATAASVNGPALLLGPTGSGKEIAARAIHRLSPRSVSPWVAVNCGAIPADLAEAELFGAKKGAFTGADRDRDGAFVQAANGTIFLDEIGDLPPPVQVKLLRVLEDGVVQPLGAREAAKVDVRVIAATHKDLADTSFRRDLFARISGWVLELPPLAGRRSDILLLWNHFAKPALPMSAQFAEALLLHGWPMNVREVRKLAERVSSLSSGARRLELSHLPEAMQRRIRAREASAGEAPADPPRAPSGGDPPAEPDETQIPDREALEAALMRARGNVSRAALKNGWHKTQVYRWLKRYGIDPKSFRDDPLD
jgi:sigma-54 dependent transcriptional regulator, acetoin dehydrogenase operon transcriptional activator AcoR